MREAQFPAPIFIRGDDIEYGVRMQEKGVKTVTMPGIGVWHEPFYIKVGGWQIYYDLRNRLIMASVYPHRFRLESPKDVLWWMAQALALHDYSTATLICKAVEDFLKGPNLFDTDAKILHEEVAQTAKNFGPENADKVNDYKKPKIGRMPATDPAIAFLVTRRILTLLFTIKLGKGSPRLLLDHEANIANVRSFPYIKTNDLGSYSLLYRPDRPQLMKLLVRCYQVFNRYVRERAASAEKWRNDIDRLRSNASWSSIFYPDSSATG